MTIHDLNLCPIKIDHQNPCNKPTVAWYYLKETSHNKPAVVGYCWYHANNTDAYGGPSYVKIPRSEAEFMNTVKSVLDE